MVDGQIETNMSVDVGVVEVNLHAICELRDGIERALVHDRLKSFGLADILVCDYSELTIVEVDGAFWVNTQSPRVGY